MSIAAPPSFDKSVALRQRNRRDSELARTVRSARERLTSNSGLPPRIELELLKQHVDHLAQGLPLYVILTALAGCLLALGSFLDMGLWIGMTLASASALLLIGIRFGMSERRIFRTDLWTRLFQGAHLIAGLPWAVLVLWPACAGCSPVYVDLVRFAATIVAIAATSIGAAAMGGAVLFTFLPLAGVLVYRLASDIDPADQVMIGVLITAIPFFSLIAWRLRHGMIEKIRDQTEKDQLISEIETARIYSDEARRRAEEANLAKSRFLATMSHELRTPLNAILGFSEVITNEILGPIGNDTYKDYVQDIHSSGQHLLDLINEILDLSRVEAGRYTLNEEAADLVSIARDCVSYVQMKADAKNIAIVGEYETQLPLLWGDPRSLRQVVLNLLSNAVKFTPSGGRIVLRVGWTAGGGQYVSVRDNGPGIPPEEIPVVLSSFGQGSGAIKSAEQGTGLGLPIVQALVKLHNGEFELHSKLREGTEAIAILPHARVLEVMAAMPEFS